MGRPEDERVKIPALIHLTRLEYDYLSLKTNDYDIHNNGCTWCLETVSCQEHESRWA